MLPCSFPRNDSGADGKHAGSSELKGFKICDAQPYKLQRGFRGSKKRIV